MDSRDPGGRSSLIVLLLKFAFPILWLLLLGALIFVVVWLVRAAPSGRRHEEAIDVLRRRLAAGEITQDEYQSLLKVLKG